jgi:hypothetical protein
LVGMWDCPLSIWRMRVSLPDTLLSRVETGG